MEGIFLRDIFSVNSIIFNIYGWYEKYRSASSRNTFQSGKKCRWFGIIFQSTIF